MPIDENRIGEDRHRDDAGEEARREHAALRVDRHHVHRRELLAGLHQADLGGERRAGAAREEQRGDDRPELARQREVDDQPERLGRAVGDERVVHLQRQHEADREPRGEDDDERQVADRVDLRDDEVRPTQRRRAGAQELDEEGGVVAEDAQHLERAPADGRDHAVIGARARRRAMLTTGGLKR